MAIILNSFLETFSEQQLALRFLVLFSCVGFLIIAKYVYRFWFHPLAAFPGPPLARISSLWSASAARKLQKAQAIHAAHEKYGSVVRIAPNELSFSDPAMLKTIYGHGHRNPKSDFYAGGKFTATHENVFSMRNISEHAGRRSVMAPIFSSRFVSDYVPAMQKKIEQTLNMMQNLSAGGKAPVDLYHWIHCMALDIVFHFTLNHESGTLVTGKAHPVIRDLEDFQAVFAWTALFPPLRQFGRFVPIRSMRKPFVSLHGWIEFCLDVVRRERANDQKASFINRLLENKDSFLDRRLEDIEITEELISIMFAGSGTAANTIVFLVWAVLEHPKVHETLVEELDRELPLSVTAFSADALSRLPYLNAVIMEALRRYPTIPGLQPRVVASTDFEVYGTKLPRGTIIGSQNYTIHMDPVIFPNPKSFSPERWLADDTAAQKAAFNGFGMGPRACIGRNVAMWELQLFVAAFFRRFDPKISEDLRTADMVMTDGFSGGPAGQKLPLYLVERD